MSRVPSVFKPLTLLLWLAGLHLANTDSKDKLRKALTWALNGFFVTLSVFSVTSLCVFNVTSLLNTLHEGKYILARMYTTAYAFCVLYLTLTIPTTTSKQLKKLIRQMDAYVQRFDPRRKLWLTRRIVAVGAISIALCSVTILVYLGLAGIIVLDSPGASKNLYTAGILQSPFVILAASFYSTLTLFCASFEYIVVWCLLQTHAYRLAKDMRLYERRILASSPGILEDFRQRHEDLSQIVSRASRIVSHFLAVVYGGGIPCFLFTLHGFVYRTLDWKDFLSMTAFFVELTITLITANVTGALLNIQMHKPAEFLFPLNIEKMPGRGPEIVAAFLARLQGAPIGFTVYRLFTIDTSTILMVCGTILTYAVVIIQFQPGISGTPTFTAPPSTAAVPNLSPGLAEPALNTSV